MKRKGRRLIPETDDEKVKLNTLHHHQRKARAIYKSLFPNVCKKKNKGCLASDKDRPLNQEFIAKPITPYRDEKCVYFTECDMDCTGCDPVYNKIIDGKMIFAEDFARKAKENVCIEKHDESSKEEGKREEEQAMGGEQAI